MDERRVLNKLRNIRRERKITLQDMAFTLGIHRNSLSRIEKGKIENVRYEFVKDYAEALGLELTLISRV